MNKTVNINLAGIFFHIDEDAFLKLQRYLDAIKHSFTDSQGRSEILSDIEARIAELFNERIQNDKQVVSINLVDDVIAIMGQPEDYIVDDEIFEDESINKKYTKTEPIKKLYRDTDNSYIAGVAGGFSHYLGIDIIWVRLIWILFSFVSGGTFILIYCICWALIPEANTTAEKLTMTGEAVNISNIEKKIKDGISIVSEKVKNVDFKKHGESLKEGFENLADNITETVKSVNFEKQNSQLKGKSQNFFETIGDIIIYFLRLFAKFFGAIMIFVGIVTLLALIIALFSVNIINAVHIPGIDLINITHLTGVPEWLMSVLLFFALSIPFFFLFYLGLKIIVSNLKSVGNSAKFILLGLWVVSILSLAIIGVKQANEYSYNAHVTNENKLNITAKDTLRIKMNDTFFSTKNSYVNYNNFKLFKTDDGAKVIASTDIKFIVRSTQNKTGKIEIVKNAYGKSYDNAIDKARITSYNYELKNNTLVLDKQSTIDAHFNSGKKNVKIIIYLPIGTTLFADDNTYRYHRNSSIYNDILRNGMEEKYMTVEDGRLVCQYCSDKGKDEKEDVVNNDSKNGIEINEDGIIIKTDTNNLEINENGIKANSDNVNVKIDDNGVKITTKNNDN